MIKSYTNLEKSSFMLIYKPSQSPCTKEYLMFSQDDDKFKEECGVFGIWNTPQASVITALGLHALQHRGQESSGIVSYDGNTFHTHRAMGLVGDIFGDAKTLENLPGTSSIGHNRYATTGGSDLRNVQPLYADYSRGGLALAHNGNLTNAASLKEYLRNKGCLFQSTTDSEIFLHTIAMSKKDTFQDKISDAFAEIKGAYSLVILCSEGLFGVRDPHGIRPLVLGKLHDAFILASETCALDIVGATFIRDIEPGELIKINDDGIVSYHPFQKQEKKFCVFEYVYFARPDSIVEGTPVYEARKNIGKQLALEAPATADVVVPVPDSGVPSALGYAEVSGLRFEFGIIRNHYVGRTFIEPSENIRHLGVRLKHSGNKSVLDGKRVVLIDDSIVRGTTIKKIVALVRQNGAKEVHVRISSPPTTHPCFYGINTPDKSGLLAHRHSVEKIKELIDADSLSFLCIDGLTKALGHTTKKSPFCMACFTGKYPVNV